MFFGPNPVLARVNGGSNYDTLKDGPKSLGERLWLAGWLAGPGRWACDYRPIFLDQWFLCKKPVLLHRLLPYRPIFLGVIFGPMLFGPNPVLTG
jgi:hypothetical protein